MSPYVTNPELTAAPSGGTDKESRPPDPAPGKDRTRRIARTQGFTLIETLVGLAVLIIFFAAVALIIQQVLKNVGSSRVRSTALSVALSKMETIRNLPYTDIGLIAGIPQGSVSPQETIPVNGLDFSVNTDITYVDDPSDGSAPADSINSDYKKIRLEVSWGGLYPSTIPLILVSQISQKSQETYEGGGTLKIRVYNAQGQPVSSAAVTVDNTVSLPEVHISTLTDANGEVMLPGSPACVACYRISATKSGYSTDRTYSTTEVANPVNPDATVIEGDISQVSLGIDAVARLTVNTYTQSYGTATNVQFILRGNRIIGYDTLDEPVYKFSTSANSGGGSFTVYNLEWDIYDLLFTNSAHMLAGSSPPLPIAVTPSSWTTLPVVVAPKANTSLLVNVQNPQGQPLASASVTLANSLLGYSEIRITPSTGSADFGHAFFNSLTPETYDLVITLPGHQEATGSYYLSTNQRERVILNYAL
ncbi:hypothetical protein A2Z33_06655 [Candidatus Gottesmanbacteria bacterium RBG_16_52_11]|uniref:Uncharacterized protein n=1 Tax=Candidatus Gottesmanbacteria bacterium RBG_16_52_11 TaxID=1798374 RepID=A0A1F5YXT8_9BACT|nr:MAG: hypothetical protein A2Z33_06655 [Candidatus Gottesmanbacteria bacterium RBG_16_52_11]